MVNKEVKAIHKMIRSSTQKVNLIVKDIRKKKISDAINILKFSQKRVSKLVVKEVYVGKSIRLKRFNPQSKGRAHQIIKPYSRLTVILEESA